MWTQLIEELAIILIGLGVGAALAIFVATVVRECHRRDQHPWSIKLIARVKAVHFPRLGHK